MQKGRYFSCVSISHEKQPIRGNLSCLSLYVSQRLLSQSQIDGVVEHVSPLCSLFSDSNVTELGQYAGHEERKRSVSWTQQWEWIR